ncbi:MAG: GyrI-like domain-containing protein [Bacteroidales bacterium]|jgi:predicted transcriptional regulator YdeE|nr:GyrI-like domain-containing protein [Bacteroidales bacterium]
MAEVIKTYIEKVPAQQFIGISYSSKDRDEKLTFGAKWTEWMEKGYFDTILKANPDMASDGTTYACMRMTDNGNDIDYRIGLVAPEDAQVPEGFSSIDLPAGELGVCWFRGNSQKNDIYLEQDKCAKALTDKGFTIHPGSFFFERYVPERFTEDQNENVILDVCLLS